MKRVWFSLLAILLVLFMVACDPSTPPAQGGDQPETPEEPVTPPEEVVIEAPTWATGTYKNTIADSISEGMISLTIEEDSISVNIGTIEISSTTTTIDSSEVEGNNWIVKLSNVDVTIPNLEGVQETYNDNIVTLTIDSITANEELKMAINVEGSLSESPLFQHVADDLENSISFTTGNTTPPGGESFAPSWAIGEYTGTVPIIDADGDLKITDESFEIVIPSFLPIGTTSDGVSYKSELKDDGSWEVTLNGVVLTEGGVPMNGIIATITCVTANEELTVNVNVGIPLTINFTKATEVTE